LRLNCCNACPLKTWQKRGSAPPGRQVHGSADRTRGGGRKSTDLVETANPHEAQSHAARGGSYLDLVLDAKILRSSGTPGRPKEKCLEDPSSLQIARTMLSIYPRRQTNRIGCKMLPNHPPGRPKENRLEDPTDLPPRRQNTRADGRPKTRHKM